MSDERELSDREIRRTFANSPPKSAWMIDDAQVAGIRAVIAAAMEKAGLVGERIAGHYSRRNGTFYDIGGVIPLAGINDYRPAVVVMVPPTKPQRTPEERIAAALAIRLEGSSLDDYAKCHVIREQILRGESGDAS